jgi:hypothetical protein
MNSIDQTDPGPTLKVYTLSLIWSEEGLGREMILEEDHQYRYL